MRLIRGETPPVPASQSFSVRLDRTAGGVFAQVWFLTRGCTWDRAGACTMCNYGHESAVASEGMVESVRLALESIPGPVDELLVSPSGNMLDPVEVPDAARRAIYRHMASFRAPKLCVETRAETVTVELVEELANAFPGRGVAVEVGLESSSPWVQHYCINKSITQESFCAATSVLTAHGMRSYANVSLGAAFLSDAEAVEDACRSVRWALLNGADLAVVFPMHVKPRTLLAWLHHRGLYHSPSLWSLVEVLNGLEPESLPRVNISWYRCDYGSSEAPLRSPTTCPRCQGRMLTLLDRYRAEPSQSTLCELNSEECECKEVWRQQIAVVPSPALPDRVLHHYECLAHYFGLSEWWTAHGEEIRASALQDYPTLSCSGTRRSDVELLEPR